MSEIPVRLLLIEDSENDAELLLRELRKNNFSVEYTRAETQQEMETALDDQEWDLIISDYELPHFSGKNALDVYNSRNLEIPFIILSGTIGETTAVDMMRAGVSDYLMKNKMARLAPAVRRELDDMESRRKRKQAELALKETEEKYLQAQKMESIGTLAGGIAHDFNNILGIIIGHGSLLKKEVSDKKHQKRIDTMLNASNRGALLVRQLLTFARKSPPKFEVINLNTVVSDLILLLNEILPKRISITTAFDETIPLCQGDITQLNQVFLNLCVNARDAMKNGGVLAITTQLIENMPLKNQEGSSVKNFIKVDITDSGEGMDEQTKKRIFEPFFTTKEVGKGTGLGLPVVFGIMESHHGFIEVESEPGIGTTFSLYFPVSEIDADLTDNPAIDESSEAVGGNEVILVIEDELALREFMTEVLESNGYTVFTASNGEDGLNLYYRFFDKISVTITDNEMPGLTGFEVTKSIKDYSPSAKVILATGNLDVISKFEDIHKPDGSIEKPFDHLVLLKLLRTIIDLQKGI